MSRLAEQDETLRVHRLALGALERDFGWTPGAYAAKTTMMEGTWWTVDVFTSGQQQQQQQPAVPKVYWVFRREDTKLILFRPRQRVYLRDEQEREYVMFDHAD